MLQAVPDWLGKTSLRWQKLIGDGSKSKCFRPDSNWRSFACQANGLTNFPTKAEQLWMFLDVWIGENCVYISKSERPYQLGWWFSQQQELLKRKAPRPHVYALETIVYDWVLFTASSNPFPRRVLVSPNLASVKAWPSSPLRVNRRRALWGYLSKKKLYIAMLRKKKFIYSEIFR